MDTNQKRLPAHLLQTRFALSLLKFHTGFRIDMHVHQCAGIQDLLNAFNRTSVVVCFHSPVQSSQFILRERADFASIKNDRANRLVTAKYWHGHRTSDALNFNHLNPTGISIAIKVVVGDVFEANNLAIYNWTDGDEVTARYRFRKVF